MGCFLAVRITVLSAQASSPLSVVINHIAKENRDFIGSVSIRRLPLDELLASLFIYEGKPTLLGRFLPLKPFAVRRSLDAGVTWSQPTGPNSGLILGKEFTPGSSPVPVVEYGGRIWQAVEYNREKIRFPFKFTLVAISAPIGSDLLNAKNWAKSNALKPDRRWLSGKFCGFFEGNAAVIPQGIVKVPRVQVEEPVEYAAVTRVTKDGTVHSFDTKSDFVRMPGGAKKFCINLDPQGKGYWALANVSPKLLPHSAGLRNTVSLLYSEELREWKITGHLLHREDHEKFAFQYVEFHFDRNDIVFVSRTAWGGAFNYNDANYFTFHRVKNFRSTNTGHAVCDVTAAAMQ
jgi:hypothetical protein